jgi:hypothetical protein
MKKKGQMRLMKKKMRKTKTKEREREREIREFRWEGEVERI